VTAACEPDCSGRECGGDGCGGSCGTCPDGSGCDGNGVCVAGLEPPAGDVGGPGEFAGRYRGGAGCGGGAGGASWLGLLLLAAARRRVRT
jgi:hypothetical protein